jgi:two-component system, NtrC family, response regulator PilR
MPAMIRILLIEENPDVRPLLEHILLSSNFQVTPTESVATASSLLDNQPYDLVITDVNLPDGSGLRIADKAIAAGIKALVVTGHGLSLKPGSLEPYDYLLKPLRVGELLAGIERCLAKEGRTDDPNVVPFPQGD